MENLNDMSVTELKHELGLRGLVKTGRKVELVKRLSDVIKLAKEEEEEEEEEEEDGEETIDVKEDSFEIVLSKDTSEHCEMTTVDNEEEVVDNFLMDEMTVENKTAVINMSVVENDVVAEVIEKVVEEDLDDFLVDDDEEEKNKVCGKEEDGEILHEDELDFDDDDIDFNTNNISIDQQPPTTTTTTVDVVPEEKVMEKIHLLPDNHHKKRELEQGEADDEEVPLKIVKKDLKKGLRETVAIGHISEEPQRIAEARQPLNAASNVLYVKNLVRPFTHNLFRDMIYQLCQVDDKNCIVELWLNRIKSKAYIVCESMEIANNLQKSLDGCKWPSVNHLTLRVDYSTNEEFNWMKMNGDSNKEFVSATVMDLDAQKRRESKLKNMKIEINNDSAEVREGKKKNLLLEKENDSKMPNISGGGGGDTGVKTLEELFNKTVATPHLFWLPVSQKIVKERIATNNTFTGLASTTTVNKADPIKEK